MRKISLLLISLVLLLGLCLALNVVLEKTTKAQAWHSSRTWIEALLATKQSVADRVEENNIPLDSLNVDQEMRNLVYQFPSEMSSVMPFIRQNAKAFLSGMDGSAEEAFIKEISKSFKSTSWFDARISELKSESNAEKRISGLLDLFLIAHEINKLDEQLEWLNLPAIEAAINDMKSDESFNLRAATNRLDELKRLVEEGFNGIYDNDPRALATARKALQLKSEILFSNPRLDFDRILVSRYNIGAGSRMVNPSAMGTQPNNWSNQSSARRGGFNAEIAELSNLRGELKYRTIFKPDNGSSLPDLKLHWDAERVMFTMVDETNRWQVYEVGIDGKGLRKAIDPQEPDLEFFDASYLPNDKVISVSNIGYQAVPCVSGSDAVGNLVLSDPKNGDLRRLTFDQDANWGPTVLNNGRLMYVRWEYTDLTHYFSRMVMHMNPDGTEQRALYGSGSVFPTATFDVQPIPGHPTQFVGIISGHHGVVRSGRLIIFDPAISRHEEKGMVQEIPFSNRPIIPIIKDHMVDGVYPQFIKPYPISDKYFLVTAKLTPNSLWGLYLVDIYDNMTLILEKEGEGYIHGIPLKPRPVPPVIPEKIKEGSREATVFIQDIYEGEGLQGVPRGTVSSVRVFAYEYAYNRSPSDHVAQGIQSGWDIKRLLGEVPVEEDGSVMFTIPANTPVSLQPLDEKGRAVQWMRSWLTGMPGEIVSCVGCHEGQNETPRLGRTMASIRPPEKPETPEGGIRSFTFNLEVQPILDRACVACHNGTLERNYIGGRTDENVPGNRGYSKSYLDLHPYIHRQGPEAGMKVLYPYEYHASTSPLIQMLKRGHHGVELTDKEWRTLYTWIDFNAPYHGTFIANPYQCFNQQDTTVWDQYERRIELANKYAGGMGVDWRGEIEAYAGFLSRQPEPKPVKPEQAEPKFEEVKIREFPFDAATAGSMLSREGNTRKVVEIAPGLKLNFVKIPAGRFIMGTNNRPSDYSPAHIAEVKNSFWMAEMEITNEQFRTVFPDHDSRFHDQQWKDHVNEGYPANKPGQPVIRVSWNEAMEFCNKLSERTGLNVTLPSEMQWEWACRAGSESPFWYGNFNDDFASYENMADRQLNKMAVTGVDPQPMRENNPWYKYYTWHPKEESVDDGNMLSVAPGGYKPNPWGLYDMHGNVSEWTRSGYSAYPYNDKMQEDNVKKVVRGGSWIDHPKWSTSYFRKSFLPWQKVYNVGFRVVIEE
ncbi:MAG: SUMF1/EgtB/PvdO family nonheme iron enzyme [Bacteroidales bacterium]